MLSQSTSILNCSIYKNITEEKRPEMSKVNDRSEKWNMTELAKKIEWKER